MMSKKLFIWDFHGTLETGTVFILSEIANTLLRENGSVKQYTSTQIAGIPSFSWNTFFRHHFPAHSQDAVHAIVQDAYNESKFAHLLEKHSRPNQGASYILQAIRSVGGVNIVVSNSRQDKLGHYLDHVGLAYAVDAYYGVDDGRIASREDVLVRKAVTIKDILTQYNKYRSYAVGDTDIDFQAAQTAGIDFFYWLLPANYKERRQKLYKGASSDKMKFILGLEEIVSDL